MRCHSGTCSSAAVAAAAGEFANLHIWDAADGSLLAHARFKQPDNTSLNDVATQQTGGRTIILSCGYTCSLVQWLPSTGEAHHPRVGSPLWHIKPLPSGRAVVAGPHGVMAFQFSASLPGHQPRDAGRLDERSQTERAPGVTEHPFRSPRPANPAGWHWRTERR